MPNNGMFLADFKHSFIVAAATFTMFFAVALFFELAVSAIFQFAPSQARICLSVGCFMLVGTGYFLFSKNSLGNKVGGAVVSAIVAAIFLGLRFYFFQDSF